MKKVYMGIKHLKDAVFFSYCNVKIKLVSSK